MDSNQIIDYLKRVEALSRIGLSYSENPYDIERYQELKEKTHQVLSACSPMQLSQISLRFDALDHYPTPKVDVRAIVLQENKVLMVQERVDSKWALPGEWCDVGYSPKENIEKEVLEESGFEVKAIKLLSVWDKSHHQHPPELEYVYKLSFQCEITGGSLHPGHEALDAQFFSIDSLPDLSLPRNTAKQIKTLYALAFDDKSDTIFD